MARSLLAGQSIVRSSDLLLEADSPPSRAVAVLSSLRLALVTAANRVHTPAGGLLIESIAAAAPDILQSNLAYNLIVADFNSYFVGEHGILVHDNTPRRPTAAAVPGLAKGN